MKKTAQNRGKLQPADDISFEKSFSFSIKGDGRKMVKRRGVTKRVDLKRGEKPFFSLNINDEVWQISRRFAVMLAESLECDHRPNPAQKLALAALKEALSGRMVGTPRRGVRANSSHKK